MVDLRLSLPPTLNVDNRHFIDIPCRCKQLRREMPEAEIEFDRLENRNFPHK
jgi:hypothetical protein